MKSGIIFLILTVLGNLAEAQFCREMARPKRIIQAWDSQVDVDEFVSHLNKVDQKLAQYIFGDPERFQDQDNPMLNLRWQANTPEVVKNLDGKKTIQRAARPYYRIVAPRFDTLTRNDGSTVYNFLNRIHGFSGPWASFSSFYDLVYINYAPKIRESLIAIAHKVDELLPIQRQSYGTVWADFLRSEGEFLLNKDLGTLRIFDGTPGLVDAPSELPVEIFYRLRNLSWRPEILKLTRSLEDYRAKGAGFKIFEIGKLSILSEIKDVALRDRIMKIFEIFVYREYLSKYHDGVFLVHVTSQEHYDLYRRRYGFEEVTKIALSSGEHNGAVITERTLALDIKEFKRKLGSRLGLN